MCRRCFNLEEINWTSWTKTNTLSLEDLHSLILGYINVYVYNEMQKINKRT